MARFQHLTWNDLDRLTRDELIPRLEAEQGYWARKEKRGLSNDDRQARQEFSKILFAAFDPSGIADSMAETIAWVKGDRRTDTSFWSEKPGRGQRAE